MTEDPRAECYVHQIATAVPEQCLYTQDVGRLLEPTCISRRSAKLLGRLARLTGIEKRHLAILDYQSTLTGDDALYRPAREQPHGPGMGARSRAFERAADRIIQRLLQDLPQHVLRQIDTLITVSCTHASSPGLEKPVFAHAPVPPSVDRWNLGFMGCSAALAGVRLVRQMAGNGKRALIVACELSSLHFQYTDQIDQMTANLLFADGAAAMILAPSPSRVRVRDCRCAALPRFADQMVWRAGDHGLQLQLAPELPEALGASLPDIVERFLADNAEQVSSIDHWLVHPGGPQILDRVQDCLRLPETALELSRSVLKRYGNMSSPTIVFILNELFSTRADGKAVAMAFGPGLTIELALVDIHHSAC